MQYLRKVKGHATKDDVEAGIITEADKDGNDKSDGLADDGVDTINGKGLVALGKRIAERHDKYKKLMKRGHAMIAVVTIAEKTERATQTGYKLSHLGTTQRSRLKLTFK